MSLLSDIASSNMSVSKFEQVLCAFKSGDINLLSKIYIQKLACIPGGLSNEELNLKVVEGSLYRNFTADAYIPQALRSSGKKFMALSSLTSGDCLYSSMSILLVGNNRLVEDLRILTCIELYLNPEFYCKHPCFHSVIDDHPSDFKSLGTILKVSVSHSTLDKDVDAANLVKTEAIHMCEKYRWTSYLCILALATVVNRPIFAYYPDFGLSKYKNAFQRKVLPRNSVSESKPLNILFCRVGRIQSATTFVPNHYVPLLEYTSKRKLTLSHDSNKKVMSQVPKLSGQTRLTSMLPSMSSKVVEKGESYSHVSSTVYSFFFKLPQVNSNKPISDESIETSSQKSHPEEDSGIASAQLEELDDTTSISKTSVTAIPKTNIGSSVPVFKFQHKESSEITSPFANVNKYDIATYHKKARNLPNDDVYDLIKNVFVPSETFIFPKVGKDAKSGRSFRNQWLKEHTWLHYSPSLNGGFCLPCVLFSHKAPTKFNKAVNLVVKPICASHDSASAFTRHEKPTNGLHSFCNHAFTTFVSNISGKSLPIDVMVSSLRQQKIQHNRKLLVPIIDTIKLCGHLALPLRGHRDDSSYRPPAGEYSEASVGNFIELLNSRIRAGDTVLKEHYEKHAKNASYFSKTTQNDLVKCCGDVISEKIISDVKRNKFFSILADEVTDSSNNEQMSLVLRFVDENFDIREDFIRFLLCKDGLSGQKLSVVILNALSNDLGLDIADCRGQGYDGAGSVAGHINGCSAHILRVNRKALYTHCFNHRLNLAVAKTCSVQYVRNLFDEIKDLSYFFNLSVPRQKCLEKNVERFCPESRKKKLLDVCRTRWVERIIGLDVFQELFVAILNALEDMSINENKEFNSETQKRAGHFLDTISSFKFIVSLVITRSVFDMTLGVTQLLQTRNNDIADGVHMIDSLKDLVTALRNDIDSYHNKQYEEALLLAKSVDVAEAKPRTCRKQQHRPNPPADDPRSYFKISISIPLMEHLQSELNSRFDKSALTAYTGLYLIPSKIISSLHSSSKQSWKVNIQPFLKFYEEDFPNPKAICAELDHWETYWVTNQDCCPNNVKSTLKAVPHPGFENIKVALRILGTLPVTSCECERSFSALRRLKDYKRSTMVEERLNGLALMHVHRSIQPDTEAVINKFAAGGNRRLELF